MLGLSIAPRRITAWIVMGIAFAALAVGSITGLMSSGAEAAREAGPPLEGVTQLTTGYSHTCGIADEEAYCWGRGHDGLLGNNSTKPSTIPVAVDTTGVLSGKTITQISSGSYHTCALADGQVYCWGANTDGKLGNNSTAASSVPVAVDTTGVLAGKTVTQVSSGGHYTCALADGQAYCWGSGNYGQLGNNSTSSSSVPVAVDTTGVLSGKTITQISSGSYHTCALADGQAYCWGFGSGGKLGNNSTSSRSTPVAVSTAGVLAGKTVTQVTAGGIHTCALADGQAYCWGSGNYGQLGNNSTSSSSVPVAVDTTGVLAGKALTQVSAGGNATCIVADERPYCWGFGSGGRLGNNSTADSSTPVAVNTASVLADKAVVQISVGNNHTCTVANEQAYCWGAGDQGQLGNNLRGFSSTPVSVTSKEIWVPEITSLSYQSEYVDRTDRTLYIYGQDFDESVTVTIGGVDAPVVSRDQWGNGYVGVQIPALSTPGDVDVVVTNSNGRSDTLTGGFTYKEFIPEIEAVIESTVRVNISGLLFIEGAGFDDAATVTIGGVLAPVVDLQDDSIVVTIPVASAPGVVDVVVTNGNGRSATLHNGFTYIESGTVDSVTFEREGDRVLMTVTGENLIDEIDPESGQGLYWYYNNNLYGGYYGTGGTTFVLNGTSLDWCTEGTGMSEADFEGEPLNGSDDPPCYHLGGFGGEVFFVTPTTFKAWLPGSFDTTSTGTVSINGSAVFTFNSPIPGDEGGVQPVATVDKQSLLGTPTIGKRPTFSGTATPGAAITVTVHSDPVTCTTTADEDGKWSCTLGQDLPAGDHTVYIHLVNPDSTIQELGPYAVTVSTGADTPPVIANDTEQAGDATTNDTTAMGVGAPNTGMERLQQIVASPRGAGVMIAALLAAALVLVAGVYVAMRRTRRAPRLSRR